MKTLLKTIVLVATLAGLASCGSNPDVHVPDNDAGGQTIYIPPGDGK